MKETLELILFGIILFVLGLVLNALICGCFCWFIGLFFGEAILGWLANIGITNITMFQLGMIFGVLQSLFFSGVRVK